MRHECRLLPLERVERTRGLSYRKQVASERERERGELRVSARDGELIHTHTHTYILRVRKSRSRVLPGGSSRYRLARG